MSEVGKPSLFPVFGITAEQSAANVVAFASDPTLKGVSGFYFSKPQSLEKRQKLAFDGEHVASLRRVLANHAAVRSALLTA
ncbi:hypothetical protein ACWD4K_26870 [Streptomyces gelaticus]